MRNLYWKAALAIVALLFATQALAQFNFCFGPTIARSVPNPVFDGDIAGDNGWLNSFLYRGGNGSPDANILLQGNSFTDGSGHQRLALGITALNDTEWDAGDSVVVLFHATGGGGTFGALVISPLQNDVAPNAPLADGRPGTSKYYTSATGAPFTFTSQGNAPTWVTWGSVGTAGGGACSIAQPGTNCQWTVEMGIDLTASGLGSIDKLYVDVAEIVNRVNPNGPNGSAQFSWPPGLTLTDTADVSTDLTTVQTPAVSDWGTASTSSSACKGVFVGYSDISAGPLDAGGSLQAGVNETFTAKIHNSGADANGVRVHFSHAPFGICGLTESCFQEFGVSNTPTSCPNGGTPPNCCGGTAACIPPDPSNAGTGLQASWTPTNSATDLGHQCIRVKLEATTGGTTFVNMGDFHNMWVDHSSNLSVQARIDMTNVPPPQGGGKQRVRLYSHRQTQYAYADGTVPGLAAATFTAQIITQYRGYRYTGKHITLNGVKSEVWEPVGAYAYTIQHAMDLPFETAFEQRHANVFQQFCSLARTEGTPPPASVDCIARVKADMAKNPRLVLQINTLLDKETEKPSTSDWSFELGGVQRIGQSADQVELQVPVNGIVTVPTKINYIEKKKCSQPFGVWVPLLFAGLLVLGGTTYLIPRDKERGRKEEAVFERTES
jgi:hypothetical protein